jgi:cytokinin dehydrogenase
VTTEPFSASAPLYTKTPAKSFTRYDHPRDFSQSIVPKPGSDMVKKTSKLGLFLLGGALMTSLAYGNISSPTAVLEKPLIQGVDALVRDQEFDAIKEFYYDVGQYDWVAENYSTDFGKLTVQPPRGVFKPRTEDQLLKFIALVNKHAVRITCRGQGHTTDGQTLCKDSIVIAFGDIPKELRFANQNKDSLVVSAHATWKELLDFTIPEGRTVPVLTDYLPLSVGGTLSIGGLGGSSFKKGSQADNVLSFRILTFDGQILTCSKTENAELFHAALCSLGQMGIMLDVTVSLVESKQHAHCRSLYYRNFEQFLKDQRTLFAKGKIDHLKGYIQKKNGELYHVIETTVFDNASSGEYSEMFEGLSPDIIEKRDLPYKDFAHEVTHFADFLSQLKKWDVPHPWYGVLLSEDQIAEHVKMALKSPFLTGSEPVLLYPLDAELLKESFLIRPEGKTIYLFTLLYNCSPVEDPYTDCAKIVEHNKKLYQDAVSRGGCYYLPQAMPSLEEWKRHFGKMWPVFSLMKAKYDPHHIKSLRLVE